MKTREQKAADLGLHLSGRRRDLGGLDFNRAQKRLIEESAQRWLDSWVIDEGAELLPAGKIRDAFLREARNRTVPADLARYNDMQDRADAMRQAAAGA